MLDTTTDEIWRNPVKYFCQVEAGETLVIFRVDQAIIKLKSITT